MVHFEVRVDGKVIGMVVIKAPVVGVGDTLLGGGFPKLFQLGFEGVSNGSIEELPSLLFHFGGRRTAAGGLIVFTEISITGDTDCHVGVRNFRDSFLKAS